MARPLAAALPAAASSILDRCDSKLSAINGLASPNLVHSYDVGKKGPTIYCFGKTSRL